MEALIASRTLGPRHVPVMVRLATEGPMSVGELAESLGLSLPSASLLVGDLSRQGLVERREDERDRRRTIVTVADAYHDDMVAAYTVRSAPVRRALARLSAAERAVLIKGFRLIGEEQERAVAEAEPAADAPAATA
jgi:DNA-binding MarR family transcriptional regulator